jgi:hypothetical protein
MNMSIFDKAKEVAKGAVGAVSDATSAVVDTTKAGAEAVGDTTKDTAGTVADTTKNVLGGIGGVLKKAGEAAVNAAEGLTGQDLNKDGTVGGKDPE